MNYFNKPVMDITLEDLLSLVEGHVSENQGLEFKQDGVKPESVAKEVCAMANADGGLMLLGVPEAREGHKKLGYPTGVDGIELGQRDKFSNSMDALIKPRVSYSMAAIQVNDDR